MYLQKQFEESRVEIMRGLMRTHPLATLITLSPSGLNADHIPLHLSENPLPFGTLRGHIAHANPLWKDHSPDVEVLAVFHGPDTYITPSWYATKKETGKVAPTWNYAVVHAYGHLRVIDDAVWLRSQLDILTRQNEADFPESWEVSDAPPEFVEKVLQNIIGIEMVITRLIGKWKVSQNQPASNQASVIKGLRESDQPDAGFMADLISKAGINN